MKVFTILAVPSILATATPLSSRQEAGIAADTNTISTLGANFCIGFTRPECKGAIGMCMDEDKVIADCIRDEHPACITDQNSPCPSGTISPEQVVACKKASEDYGVAMFVNDCEEANEVDESDACKTVKTTFGEAWDANNCEAAFGADEGGDQIELAPEGEQ
ncbi:hypothetical protein X797_007143 [Metarhizium robertsii]|uniref:Uncharacterized protein n=2 Tax=Metarhizium robertsii TaxID=568076 RepID=E9F4E7_METRA|nr:uncharacterized protein MAA_07146 [Metarhizium robertsii ARSEF 23]EFY97504.1 hypothetical protein MAA_07146 [Metarhizium robertsii ARSEF 23]EXU99676.1 hypothetical protein X797_007143 [Metarhizium robertsii]